MIEQQNIVPEIITTQAALERLVQRLCREPMVACDLEADSMHHYQEKVCLIQISSPVETVLVDPLALTDLSPLKIVMADSAIRKVFHGADYDIRSLHRDFTIEVNNLFDTMIACQFLGEREIGLAAVLKKRFGVELDKRYQKADWTRRPLSSGMIEYAMKDTSLLLSLYKQLHDDLVRVGRLPWVEEECELLAKVRAGTRTGEPLFLRFKGASRMEPRTLAVLEELLSFRDERAKLGDVPPFKILGSETVRVLAEIRPRKIGDMSNVPGLSAKLVDRYGQAILDAVAKGMAVQTEALPYCPRIRHAARDRRQEDKFKKLKLWRERRAAAMGVEAGVMANNALLEALSLAGSQENGEREVLLGPMKRWQIQEFGDEVLAVLGKI